jgi:predicted RND superfamily exporter protein
MFNWMDAFNTVLQASSPDAVNRIRNNASERKHLQEIGIWRHNPVYSLKGPINSALRQLVSAAREEMKSTSESVNRILIIVLIVLIIILLIFYLSWVNPSANKFNTDVRENLTLDQNYYKNVKHDSDSCDSEHQQHQKLSDKAVQEAGINHNTSVF